MDFGRIEVLPTPDLLCSCSAGKNDSMPQRGIELTERAFMTMIWIDLRDQDNVRRRYLGQMIDTRRNGMSCDGKLGMNDRGVAEEPRINENRESSRLA